MDGVRSSLIGNFLCVFYDQSLLFFYPNTRLLCVRPHDRSRHIPFRLVGFHRPRSQRGRADHEPPRRLGNYRPPPKTLNTEKQILPPETYLSPSSAF